MAKRVNKNSLSSTGGAISNPLEVLREIGQALAAFGTQLSIIGNKLASIQGDGGSGVGGASLAGKVVTLTGSPVNTLQGTTTSALNAINNIIEVEHLPHDADAFPEGKSSKRPRHKQIRDKNAPKRPPTGYLLFCQEHRAEIHAAQPDLPMVDVVRKLAGMWEALPDKSPYMKRAKELARIYEEAKAEYEAKQANTESTSGTTSRDSKQQPESLSVSTESIAKGTIPDVAGNGESKKSKKKASLSDEPSHQINPEHIPHPPEGPITKNLDPQRLVKETGPISSQKPEMTVKVSSLSFEAPPKAIPSLSQASKVPPVQLEHSSGESSRITPSLATSITEEHHKPKEERKKEKKERKERHHSHGVDLNDGSKEMS